MHRLIDPKPLKNDAMLVDKNAKTQNNNYSYYLIKAMEIINR